MQLAAFIEHHLHVIVADWEAFAAEQSPAANTLDRGALRDHADAVLAAIVVSLQSPPTGPFRPTMSMKKAAAIGGEQATAGQLHALSRAAAGFTPEQLVAEYGAMRSSVLQRWLGTQSTLSGAADDVMRFNNAVDTALAEAVHVYTQEVERWRQVFLSVLGHELRNPLDVVLLSTRVLQQLQRSPSCEPHLDRLLRGAQRMQRLLDDLLDYNRSVLGLVLTVRKAPVDLAVVCEEELSQLRSAFPGSPIEFSCAGPTEGLWDASRLRQLISNLVSNAVHHGTRGAAIRVQLEGSPHELRLTVRNQGRIIEPAAALGLFEPLRRGASDHPGTDDTHMGLGLFIVRQVAIGHGGSVMLASSEGDTIFTVVLPRAA